MSCSGSRSHPFWALHHHGTSAQFRYWCPAILLSAFSRVGAADLSAKCLALGNSLQLENTTILDVSYIAAPTNVSTLGSCQSSAPVTAAPLCCVYFAWLPDTWFGRFLGLGNGGLNGCIQYVDLDYGASLHFATRTALLNAPEVINDFASRAVHVEAVIGKQLVATYYNTPAAKSYFLGCSTGGRQGTQAALRFPEDFDGILAGAPPTDFNHLAGWDGLLGHYVGAVNTSSSAKAEASPKFITRELNGTASQTTGCLSQVQVEALKNIYSPLFEADGQLLYRATHPDWKRYAILNRAGYRIALFDAINPGGMARFDGDMSAFRERGGGEFITDHGRRDPLISSTHSKRVYDLISHTLSLPPAQMDYFYRLFLIPGVEHCFGVVGPTNFRQGVVPGMESVKNDTAHNILLALVHAFFT
ncbi:tannase and feruloyl esterase [Mycena alexandri]|uniref:Carboxylic ester hydrolase n=1 Tax=Mycena alexandri TaxID=1745969 RepID=A0AAD6SSV9_9AGAR|nr:tannase and feruloyl esterase [Mycena alexandri]